MNKFECCIYRTKLFYETNKEFYLILYIATLLESYLKQIFKKISHIYTIKLNIIKNTINI